MRFGRGLWIVAGTCVLALAAGTAGSGGPSRERFADELAREQFGRDRSVDVEHYTLDLSFDPERREVRGSVSIRMHPLNDGLGVVELDAGEMAISRVVLEGGEAPPELLFRHDGERLRIGLPRPYAATEELTLTVHYAAQPRWGLHFVVPDDAYPDRPAQVWSQGETDYNHYWFPSFDYPNDRATSEEIYTVPADWTAVGNGVLVERRDGADEGTRTFHYRMDVPHVSYLISVIAGRFEKYEDAFDGIPVEYYVPPGTGREKALRSFGETPDILRFFSDKTGVRYPYPKYAQACAVDFIHGGMENIGATTNTADTLHDERAALEYDSQALVAHEAAHQWFGDLLTCADWSHAWLNEGFATYWENLWFEHARGEDEFLYRMLLDRESYLREDRDEYRRPIVEHTYTDPMDLFDSHLYPKSAWVLHMIRGVLGDDRFFRAMAHYTQTHREQVVETDDLRRAIAEATGTDLGGFFEQWFRRGGHPEFDVTREWDADRGVLSLHFAQTQDTDDLTPIFRLPLDVAVDTPTGTVVRRLQIEHATADLTLHLDSEPLLVRIDPEFRVLMELNQQRPPAERLRALSDDPSVIGRIFAARDLARHGSGASAVEALRAALQQDPFYGVRIEAAAALGVLRGDTARAALIEAAAADTDARVCTAAARALGTFRDDEVVAEALSGLISAEPAYGTLAAAVRSLAKIHATGARQAALAALDVDSYYEKVRSAALEALGELGGDESLAVLRTWVGYGKPRLARVAAIGALAQAARASEDDGDDVELLVARLDDPEFRVRRAAIAALGTLRAAEAVEALTRSASVEADSRMRRDARAALRKIREGEARGTSVAELAAEVERLRERLGYQESRIDEIEKNEP